CFINAAGPWVDRVAGLAGAGNSYLKPTKGVHILLPKLSEHHAIAFQAKRDGRIMFVLPWNDCSIVGTTDTDYSGAPDDVRAEAEKIVDELLNMLGQKPRECVTDQTPLPPPVSDADQLIADAPKVYASDIRRACEEELAISVDDVMRRRTSLALSRFGGPEIA